MKPTKLPKIRPIPMGARLQMMKANGHLEPDFECFKMGEITIMRGTIPCEGLHMSISHPRRYPTWNEIKAARYELIPIGVTMAMLLPPPDQYINLHKNCFHLHQIPNEGGPNLDNVTTDP